MRYDRKGQWMAPEGEDLAALEAIFLVWVKDHGIVWFGHDIALAEAIVAVLKGELDWDAQ